MYCFLLISITQKSPAPTRDPSSQWLHLGFTKAGRPRGRFRQSDVVQRRGHRKRQGTRAERSSAGASSLCRRCLWKQHLRTAVTLILQGGGQEGSRPLGPQPSSSPQARLPHWQLLSKWSCYPQGRWEVTPNSSQAQGSPGTRHPRKASLQPVVSVLAFCFHVALCLAFSAPFSRTGFSISF